ncbi:hypothetical protein BDA99DRAFT_509515 [Phascolomyces articulosus]|uniref:Uncharacterized protein n=1 Tax=Phascolomyces articulosus TaxID=60185 RepID=A0AAD5KDD9_9FUNG|nr:hypothetical protein BDA99DRAFT_509515 [Phascolomyces articulosus]
MPSKPSRYLQDRYRRAIADYERFIKIHRPDRLHDICPVFPVTKSDLCLYIDYKAHFRYQNLQRYLSALKLHPKHGTHWVNTVLRSNIVEEKKRRLRLLETSQDNKLKYGYNYCIEEHEKINNVFSGVNKKGHNIVTPKLPSSKESRIKNQKIAVPIQGNMNNQTLLHVTTKYGIISSSPRKIEETMHLRTIELNVNQLATKVHIIPYVTPISLHALSSNLS